jgi:hypothetical protein
VRNLYEVLKEKEDAVERVRREIAVLRAVTPLLADESDVKSNIPASAVACRKVGAEPVSQLRDALRTVAPLLADDFEEHIVRLRARLIEAAEHDPKLCGSETVLRHLRHIAASWLGANPMWKPKKSEGPKS